MPSIIAVCGSDECPDLSKAALQTAEEVGRRIAAAGAILLTGGRGGVMRAACRGAKQQNGSTVAFLPDSLKECNEFVDIPLSTGLGKRRNSLIVHAADVVIAIAGRWGTLNEVSYAMILGKPVVLVKGFGGCVDELATTRLFTTSPGRIAVVSSAAEAVSQALSWCRAEGGDTAVCDSS